MKKMLSLLICLLLVFTMFCTGCGSDEATAEVPAGDDAAETTEVAKEEAGEESNLTEAGTFPIVKETVELSMLLDQGSNVESLIENDFTNYIQDYTNVKLDITEVPTAQLKETINLIIASRDYPDVMIAQHWTAAEIYNYGNAGVFTPLNDLVDNYSTYYKEHLDNNPDVRKELTAPDGEMYCYTSGQMTYHMSAARKMWVQQEFLDNLGLEVPTTTEEFKQMLIAVRDGDANGNGDPNDEIPLIGCIMNDGQSLYDFTSFLSGSFIHYPGDDFWRNDGGTIQFVADTEEWKALLAYEKELYDEGLFPIESFTQDNSTLKNIAASSDDPIIFAMQSHYTGWYTTDQTTYDGIEPLIGPDGTQQAINTYRPQRLAAVITTACEEPEVAVRWLDYFYSSEQAQATGAYGPEGIGWEAIDPAENLTTGLGGVAEFQQLWDYKDVQSYGWGRAAVGSYTDEYNKKVLAYGVDGSDTESIKKGTPYILATNTAKLEPYLSDEYVPEMFYEAEDSVLISENYPTIESYVKQSQIRFITGALDLEADWDEYCAEFEKMYVPQITEIMQTTYDALQ